MSVVVLAAFRLSLVNLQHGIGDMSRSRDKTASEIRDEISLGLGISVSIASFRECGAPLKPTVRNSHADASTRLL